MNTPVLTYASKEINNVPNNDNLAAMKKMVTIELVTKDAIEKYRKEQEELKARSTNAPINSQDLAKEIMADMASNYRNSDVRSLDSDAQNENAQNNDKTNSEQTIER